MLSFGMSKEQKMIKDEVANLIKGVVAENADEMDQTSKIPEASIQQGWELGASVTGVPEEFGGFGMQDSPITTAIILEELAYGDMGFSIAVTLPSLMISPILSMGTDDQKAKYLPLLCKEAYAPCSLALNEPHFMADAGDLKTTAEKKNGAYVLNGAKCFVPMADTASHIMVAAALDGESDLFIVNKDNPGLEIGEKERNLGLYALDTHELALSNCEIPAEDRLGGDGGCDYGLFLQKCRIGMSAIGTGVARASFEFARDYAKERVQFGEPIVNRQSVSFMIAEMAYEVDAMRLMTWQAASKLEAGEDATRESYLAKIYAGEMVMKVTDWGVQVLGGHGYTREYPVERFYRNGRGISILDGMATV